MIYSERLRSKVRLYFAANYLYSKGKSHPQVVAMLNEEYEDEALVLEMADQAMTDEWRKVYNTVQELTAQGNTYGETINKISVMLDDTEVIQFITDSWYAVETVYMENYIESQENIIEGAKYLIISTIGLVAVIYFKASYFSIIIWSLSTFVALAIWLHGRYQRRLSAQLEKILKEDYTQFGKKI